MLIHMVKFESELSLEGVLAVSKERKPRYQAQSGLIQKYYVNLPEENHYCGVMIWENAEALAAFRETDLAQTVGAAYKVKGAPDVTVAEILFLLRPDALPALEAVH